MIQVTILLESVTWNSSKVVSVQMNPIPSTTPAAIIIPILIFVSSCSLKAPRKRVPPRAVTPRLLITTPAL